MKVLFVCYANVNRSQIAEAIFNRLSKNNEARSVGIAPEDPGTDLKEKQNNPILPMKEAGYDVSKAKTKRLSPKLADWADKIVFIFNREKHEKDIPAYLKNFKDKELWEVDSITGTMPFDEYFPLERKRIKLIEKHVKDLVKRIG